ncbi:MAG: hypothetical protein WC014_01185 [Bacilli bacterium]|jgi:hypothetical protein
MNIAKKAFQTYRKYLASKLAIALSFTVFVLASLAIGLFGSYLFILLVPIIILPIYICLQLANSSFAKGMPLSQKNFFAFYKVAFTPTLNGAYQVISSFLKAALIYFGFSFLVVFVMLQVYLTNDASFAQELQSITTLVANGNYQDALLAYEENATILFVSTIASLISGGFSLLAFMHFIGRNSIVPHLALSMAALPGKIAYSVHRQGLKVFKREFNGDYYRSSWLAAPIILIGFTGGVLATYFFTNNTYLILLSGFAGAFILLTPFLPYYLDVIEELFNKYKDRYLKVSINQATRVYEEIKIAQEMSEEQRKELDKLINDLKNQTEHKKADNQTDDESHEE